MGQLRRHANGMLMDLQTTLPDGQVITTLWPEDRPFRLPDQKAHADRHRKRVRNALSVVDYAALMEGRAV